MRVFSSILLLLAWSGLPGLRHVASVALSVFIGVLFTNRVPADQFDRVQPLLLKYCGNCHGDKVQESQIRFDRATGFDQTSQALWTKTYQALAGGEMPPQEAAQPTASEREQLLKWLYDQAQLQTASMNSTQRRLNRRELSAALQQLTGLPINFAAGLSEDAKVDGFDTGATALQDAADSVAQWLEITQRAVGSIRFLEPDRGQRITIDFREHEFTDFFKFVETNWKSLDIFTRSKGLPSKQGIGLYLPTQWSGDRGNSFLALPAPADKRATLKLTLRVKSSRPLPGLPHPMLWVSVGGGYIDYRSIGDQTQTLTYAVRMEDCLIEGTSLKIMLQSIVEVPYAVAGFPNDDASKPEDNIPGGIGVYRPKFDRKVLRLPADQPVPTIIIESIEVDYDHCAAWPPVEWSTGISDLKDDDATAVRLLELWLARAWRRPIADHEKSKFLSLYHHLRRQQYSFDDALRGVFQAVLMGGPFRFLASPADQDEKLAQYALAARLSFMLSGQPPDMELLSLAASGKLHDPQVLDSQVDRLLADDRSAAFFQPFVTQWLSLQQPITVTMSHLKKQDFRFGRHLKESMREETIQYITQLFKQNRPITELISSDWTMMNDILAVHYGYPNLEGGGLRKVVLRRDDPRGGGVLGHAGIQSMLCWMGDNWVIYRGAWALNHIFDDPPPPPPLEVPELSPFDSANQGKNFRELLIQHQADSRCAVCHTKMDPLGFAFQNFDISGRWRDVEYDRYHRAELDGKIEWRGEGNTRPVDASGTLPHGEQFTSYAEFKELLTKRYLDPIVQGLLKKLTLYGTGRPATILDLMTIRQIMIEQSEREYALRDLLKALVRSRIFLETATAVTATNRSSKP